MRPFRRPKTVRCRHCKGKIEVKPKGPLPLYCRGCRQRAYEKRRYSGPQVLLAQDLATVSVRDAIRAEVRLALSQLGFDVPPLPPDQPKKRSHLRVVESRDT